MVTIGKFEFAQLKEHLTFVENFKESLFPLTAEKLINHHQYNLIKFEEQAILEQNERMRVINCVLL